MFHIAFKILRLTQKIFTEEQSSRKSMLGSDRHSTTRKKMHFILDHPLILVVRVEPDTYSPENNGTADVLYHQQTPSHVG